MLISVGFLYRSENDYLFLFKQNWADCECILVVEKQDQIEKFEDFVEKLQNIVSVKIIEDSDKDCWENQAITATSGDFCVLLNSYQTWGNDFLQNVKNELKQLFVNPKMPAKQGQVKQSEPHYSQLLLYNLGYVETEEGTKFCTQVYPFLNKKPSIFSNFNQPQIFLSCISFVWPLKLIKDNNLKFDPEIKSGIIRNAVFGINVLANMYSLNNHFEPDFFGIANSLKAPLNTFSSKADLELYQQNVLNKWQLWENRFFSKLNFLSKYHGIIQKINQKH